MEIQSIWKYIKKFIHVLCWNEYTDFEKIQLETVNLIY